MKIQIDGEGATLTATLADNRTSRDFVALLPLTLTLEDYASTEKISYLPRKLSTADAPAGTDPAVGDITYYARVVAMGKEVRHSVLAPAPAHSLVPQIFEQCLAMNQRKRDVEQLSFLNGRQTFGRDPAHECRVLRFPLTIVACAVENACCATRSSLGGPVTASAKRRCDSSMSRSWFKRRNSPLVSLLPKRSSRVDASLDAG